ncbi:MAG: glycosyltransferase family 1 protein [Edaphobacter sp.]|nr:glycosyltransferase family 1 protein [Edaphobacter sp.]
MRELTVFVGGSTGSDPYSPKTWSGSSQSLLKAMDEATLLDKAIGLKLSRLQNYWLLAKNFTRNRAVWRKHFYFDPAYRNALTHSAKSIPVASPICLQIGSMFCLPTVFPNKKCISYHDGNLPELLNSGFGMEGVSRKRIDQALRYEEETSQQMAAIFTFSEYLRQSFIRDYRVSPNKVFNVGGAVNFTEIPSASPDKDYTANRILFIGTEFARKGGPLLLEALQTVRRSIPTAELHIVGPAHLDNLPAGVVFHGHLSKADPVQKQKLESLFRNSTLFALPSLYEPFGIAPLEAMLYQLPCVLTDAWALRECVTPGLNGDLAEKGSVEDLAAKITQLLVNPGRLATMGQQARELVLTRYTWPAVVARMSNVIKSL